MANNNQNQPKKDESYANYQQAGQQLLQMNAERQKNIALQRQANANQQGTTELLSQAGAMATMGGGGAAINPQTQAMLRKYGYGQPKVQRTQGREVKIVPNNIVINNNYNTVSNNNVIPQQGGGNDATNSQSRFKTWISGIFARQKEETAKRDREYQKQEWAIGKSTNRMLRQMTDAGRNVANAINPRNLGSSLGGQIKTLLFLFGMRFLSKNWTKILDITTTITGYIKEGLAFFGIGDETRVKALAAQGKDFRGRFISFFTEPARARDGKTTVISLMREMIQSFGDYIKTFIEGQMELRGIAMRSIKFPKIDFKPADSSGWNPLASAINSAISSLGDSLTNALSGMGTYIGDIFTAFVNPKAGARRAIVSNVRNLGTENSRKNQEYYRNVNRFTAVNVWDGDKANGWAVNAGDAANELVGEDYYDAANHRYLKGSRRYALLENALEGNKLRNTAGSQISQGRDLLGAINNAKTHGRIDTARFASGVSRLYEAAKENENGVVVDQEFVNTLVGEKLKRDLTSTRDLVPVKMKYVVADLDASEYGNRGAELYKEAAGTSDDLLVGKVPLLGWGLNVATAGLQKLGNSLATHLNSKKLILVPESDPRPAVTKINDVWGANSTGDVKDLGKPVSTYYRLTPTAIEKIMQHRISKDADIDNYETFLPGVDKFLVRAGGGEAAVNKKWSESQKKNLQFTQERFGGNQRDYDITSGFNEIRRIELAEQKLRSKMENHPFMGYVNHATNNAKKLVNKGLDGVNNVVRWFGTTDLGRSLVTERVTNKTVRANAQRIMDFLINEGGFTPDQAIGILGNLYIESNRSLSPQAINPNDSGKRSVGLAQWRDDRDRALQQFATSRGKSWDDFDTQLEFLLWELENKEKAANNAVRKSNNFQEAAYAWRLFERYNGWDTGERTTGLHKERQKAAWSMYNMLKNDGYFEGKRLDINGATSNDGSDLVNSNIPEGSIFISTARPGADISGGYNYYDSPGSFSMPSTAAAPSNNGYYLPLQNNSMVITSPFGNRADPVNKGKVQFHKGIDIRANNENIYATENGGKVVNVNNNAGSGGGKSVTVEYDRGNGNKIQTTYRHLSSIGVREGEGVQAGQQLGVSGNTGRRSTAPHLHFEVSTIDSNGNSQKIDPTAYLADISQAGGLSLNMSYKNGSGGIIVNGSSESIFENDTIERPFGEEDIKTEKELKQQEVKSAVAREAMEVWEKYSELKEAFNDYNHFENYWITKGPSKRRKLERGYMAYHNHKKAIEADPNLSKLGVHRFAEIWASKSTEPWEVINRAEQGRQFEKIEGGADAFAKKIEEQSKDTLWIRNDYERRSDKKWKDEVDAVGESGAYKKLYTDIIEGRKGPGYDDKIAASILFGDDYNKLREELNDTNLAITNAKYKGVNHDKEITKKDFLQKKLRNFEQSAYNYTTLANNESKSKRKQLFSQNQRIAQIKNQILSYEEERKAIIAKSERQLLNWPNMTAEEINELELNTVADIAWINDKQDSLRQQLYKIMDGLGEDQEEFKIKLEQEIKLQTKTGEELWGEFNNIMDSGKSQIEALGEMMREYGKEVLEKMRNELAKTITFFQDHELTEDMFNSNYNPTAQLNSLEKIQEQKKALVEEHGSWTEVPPEERIPLELAEKNIKQNAANVQVTVQGNQALSEKGLAEPIKNADELNTKAQGVINKVNKLSNRKTTMEVLPGGWGGTGYDENYASNKPGEKPVFTSKYYNSGYIDEKTGKINGPLTDSSGFNKKRKTPVKLSSGKTVGGYTEPGNPLTPSGYVLHKNEFVVNSGSLRNPLISDIVRAIDVYQGTNKDSVKTPISKESILTAESSKITAINTAETNARLEQLTQAVLNLGRSGGTPKTKVPSYTP